MVELAQALWDQMRAELRANTLPQSQQACRTFSDGTLGSLTELQSEDLASIQRSIDKLARRFEGEAIDWADYGEAAHALRGPLNATIGFSRLMLKGIDGPITKAQSEALETIYSGSRLMLTLFNLLLDALLVFANEMCFEIEPVQASEILDELVAVGKTLADNRDFTFEADVSTSVATVGLQIDTKRAKRALSALLAALSKYMSGDVLTLRAWVDLTENENGNENKLLIQLTSQGCQLPTPLLADLSTLLTAKADQSLPFDAHLRLGLAWHFLTAMKGQLEAHQSDEVYTFTITLPVA